MIIRFLQILIITIMLLPISSKGQNRVDRPTQFQINLSGAFISVLGNSIADASVDDLKVNSWKLGWIFGYHLKPSLYLGYALYPSLDLTLREEWGFTSIAKDGNIVLDHKTGKIQSFELRYSPFEHGFYVSTAWMLIGRTEYSMKFKRKSDTMFIGQNEYAMDLDVRWNSKSSSNIGIGLGYNWIMNSGISFNFGVSVPPKFPDNDVVEFTPLNQGNAKITENDLALAEEFLNEETFYGPILLFVNIGYNLKGQ